MRTATNGTNPRPLQPALEPNRNRSLSDPLAKALLPPRNESQQARDRRLLRESEAKKVSDDIDEQIKQEKAALKRRKQEVKILLLGQSESGKSTTLKQFLLMHSPTTFHAERIAWRSVIYLNLIRSIRRILEALLPSADPAFDETGSIFDVDQYSTYANGRGSTLTLSDRMRYKFERYGQRLAPLALLEQKLVGQLSHPDEDEPTNTEYALSTSHILEHPLSPSDTLLSPTSTFSSYSFNNPLSPISPSSTLSSSSRSNSNTELALRPTSNWKKPFSLVGKINGKSPKSVHTGEIQGWWEDPEDPVHVLNACAQGEFGMSSLWRDKEVRQTLASRRVRMEESSGFYLNEIDRITAKKYIPTDDDVLKARLKTLGVVEHTFKIKAQSDRQEVDWKIYDVGGARNQRQAWVPYFADVNAIIFLAPISAFDQVLAEDSRINRLEDSLILWRALVSNKLLAKVNIILFLNKCDLLKAKLEAGVQLAHHMTSYEDRPNDYDSVSRYFRNKFGALHQSYTPDRERELFIHLTSVTDTRKTSTIISNVRDIILRGNLKGSKLL